MCKIGTIALYLFFSYSVVYSQAVDRLTGKVTDDKREPLPGCHVHYKNLCSVSDSSGSFHFDEIGEGKHLLCLSFVGYQHLDTLVEVPLPSPLFIRMKPKTIDINEVVIEGKTHFRNGSRSTESAGEKLLTLAPSGSLMKSLENLPGLNAMEIGANLSKPVIRGMGLHRVTVSENGIRHEGQQWGADHGLEIDPLLSEQVLVVKGASSLEMGTGALGGNLSVLNNLTPDKNSRQAWLWLGGRSVNSSVQAAGHFSVRGDRLYLKLKGSIKNSGDYSIPTDTLVYLTRKIPIEGKRLKNSAGNETNATLQTGYISPGFQAKFSIGNSHHKAGFFPGAHGIPNINLVRDDGNIFNITFPYQKVNHLKVTGNLLWSSLKGVFNLDLGWQNNLRQEWSRFHSHYPNQDEPATDPDLELQFRLNTFSINSKWTQQAARGQTLMVGIESQAQNNQVGGYNYLLPQYHSFTTGGFFTYRWQPSIQWSTNAGLRFDYSTLTSDGFFDPLLYDYLKKNQYPEADCKAYAQRGRVFDRNYVNFSAMAGMQWLINPNSWFRANLGHTFRNPTAIELGANGVHHGSFRHEQGEIGLKPESGAYIDCEFEFRSEISQITLSTYYYHFFNYLFLNPSGEWSVLPHAGQIYRYTQSPAQIIGVELAYLQKIGSYWEIEFNVEAIANRQIHPDARFRYPLPFTPPANLFAQLVYKPGNWSAKVKSTRFYFQSRSALKQNRVARNELPTNGYVVFNLGASTSVLINHHRSEWSVSVNNLFNTPYLNHISFYRKLELPEPGRDIRISVKIPII